jgi:putative endonuclease
MRPIDREKTPRMDLGRRAEHLAAGFLRRLGYDILRHNARIGRDEIDLIAFDPVDKVVVFAEVKARSRPDPDFLPELGLDRRKRRAMTRAARAWMRLSGRDDGYRLDLLCVEGGTVARHIKELNWG